jgi:2',3'-cyclic-nucleotide 2'-phosphodiesterase (5'-nucleotidase family)
VATTGSCRVGIELFLFCFVFFIMASSCILKDYVYTYNPMKPIGSRLIGLEIGRDQLRLVDKAKEYTIVTVDFSAAGGDNIVSVPNLVALDAIFQVLIAYIQRKSPLTGEIEGRIVMGPESASAQTVMAWGRGRGLSVLMPT